MSSKFLFAAMLLTACGSGDPAAPAAPVETASATSPVPCDATGDTRLSQLETEVFASCRSASCHGGGGHAGHLDLATDPYKALVGVPPDPTGAEARGWTVPPDVFRVAPGDETKSLLYLKLAMPTERDPLLGHRMPDTGQALDACDVQKVRSWIRRGAPND